MQLIASHALEVEALTDRMENQKSRQQKSLHDKLAEQRKRRMEELRRRQDAELMSEMLEGKKELDTVKLKQVISCFVMIVEPAHSHILEL